MVYIVYIHVKDSLTHCPRSHGCPPDLRDPRLFYVLYCVWFALYLPYMYPCICVSIGRYMNRGTRQASNPWEYPLFSRLHVQTAPQLLMLGKTIRVRDNVLSALCEYCSRECLKSVSSVCPLLSVGNRKRRV